MSKTLLASARDDVVARWSEVLAGQDVDAVAALAALESRIQAGGATLVLLDLGLPELGRGAGVRQLTTRFPQSKLFCFSDQPGDEEGLALLTEGVCGYANTFMHPDTLRQALQVVDAGQVWLGQRLMQALIQRAAGSSPSLEESTALAGLTGREREIAQVLAEGVSNKIIARRLEITERTVKAHLTSIFDKTGTHDRLELALLVQGHGRTSKGASSATTGA